MAMKKGGFKYANGFTWRMHRQIGSAVKKAKQQAAKKGWITYLDLLKKYNIKMSPRLLT